MSYVVSVFVAFVLQERLASSRNKAYTQKREREGERLDQTRLR